MSKKENTPVSVYPMKWYFALIFALLPISALSLVFSILSKLTALLQGDYLGAINANLSKIIQPSAFQIILSLLSELSTLAASVLLIPAWIFLIKKRKTGVKLYLLSCLIPVITMPVTITNMFLTSKDLMEGYQEMIDGYLPVIIVFMALIVAAFVLFYILNRKYFKKRDSYFQ